jgi:GNAT superfamily N-acetyltransferase
VDAADLAERLAALRRGPGAAFIASEWGPPSGVVALHWHQTLGDARPVAQVSTLLVAEDSRRRGVARLLLKTASQAARSKDCGTLQLLAGPAQADLAAFCAATGFSNDGALFARALRKRGAD